MKMAMVAQSRLRVIARELAAWALLAHTKADHAHQMRARTSIARASPAQVRSLASSVVTWVTANTNTRSHSSSTGLVRRSSILCGRSIAVAGRGVGAGAFALVQTR